MAGRTPETETWRALGRSPAPAPRRSRFEAAVNGRGLGAVAGCTHHLVARTAVLARKEAAGRIRHAAQARHSPDVGAAHRTLAVGDSPPAEGSRRGGESPRPAVAVGSPGLAAEGMESALEADSPAAAVGCSWMLHRWVSARAQSAAAAGVVAYARRRADTDWEDKTYERGYKAMQGPS